MMLDQNRIEALRAEVGAAGFDEVVDLFLEEVEEAMARLRAGSDPAALERDLHFLKGLALNLGFRHLSALCQQGERAAARHAPVDVAAVLSSYAASRRKFLALVQRAG